MEGFLTLAEAAQQLGTTPDTLTIEIEAGRVVAIVRDGVSWLSPGEVSRLAKTSLASERPAPVQEAPPSKPPVVEEFVPEPPPQPPPTALPPQPSPSAPPAPEKVEEAPPIAAVVEVESPWRERYDSLSQRFADLEKVNQRLKLGLQETEATLRRSRTARSNLESEIITLQEQLKKTQTRGGALEREVQHLTHQLERAEEKHSAELRRFRSRDMSAERAPTGGTESSYSAEEVAALRRQMEEKDRIISHEYQERAVLRAQLEERSQKFYELKARYEKEKAEWSEILARELQTHGQLKSQLEELKPKNQKGWNLFRRDK